MHWQPRELATPKRGLEGNEETKLITLVASSATSRIQTKRCTEDAASDFKEESSGNLSYCPELQYWHIRSFTSIQYTAVCSNLDYSIVYTLHHSLNRWNWKETIVCWVNCLRRGRKRANAGGLTSSDGRQNYYQC